VRLVYNIAMNFRSLDIELIHFFRFISEPIARFGLFVCFFWFGILKVLDLSPASPLVEKLFSQTIGFMSFPAFMILFGLFEVLIGVMFLIKGWEREVIPLLFIHMFTTFMPLFIVQEATWSGFLVPTLEGQYIIKNLVIIATAVGIASHLHPVPRKHK
jgi:uncharacterized membrane protein YkgB